MSLIRILLSTTARYPTNSNPEELLIANLKIMVVTGALIGLSACSSQAQHIYIDSLRGSPLAALAATSQIPWNSDVNDVNNVKSLRAEIVTLQEEIDYLEMQLLPQSYINQTLSYLSDSARILNAPIPSSSIMANEEMGHLDLKIRRTHYNSAIIAKQKNLVDRISTHKQKQILLFEQYLDLAEKQVALNK